MESTVPSAYLVTFFFLAPRSLLLAVDCGNLADSITATVSMVGTTYLSVATYTCRQGYTAMVSSGNNHRVCQADGQWSGVPLSCNGKMTLTGLEVCMRMNGFPPETCNDEKQNINVVSGSLVLVHFSAYQGTHLFSFFCVGG